jgi:hypothetical protein
LQEREASVHWLERAPLWIIGLVILSGLIIAQQLGYGARRLMARSGRAESSSDGVGYILTAALALLGLLIAFTFGAAGQRFDTRRQLVIEEANALGTTYLRIQALDDGPKAALSRLMMQYAKAREGYFATAENSALMRLSEARTDVLQARIWAETVAAIRAHPEATINPSLLQTTNDMFDLAASERAALEAHVPITVLRSLLIYSLIAAAIIGYGMAQGARQLIVSAALFLTLSLAICLILDLDRPRTGAVRVSQAPMARAIASLESMEAAKSAQPQPGSPKAPVHQRLETPR